MSGATVSRKTYVFDFLDDQSEVIRSKKALKLNSLKHYFPQIPLNDIIEYVYQYINSFDPVLSIERISLANNGLESLPLNFKLLTRGLRYLDLHNNNLQELPMEIYDLTNLEFLDVSSNSLSHLSRSRLPTLNNLRLISLKNNRFKYLPPVLGDLPNMNLVEVGDNPLILPPLELIQKFQQQSADHDWVRELKSYLVANANLIESKIYEPYNSSYFEDHQQNNTSSSNGYSTTSNNTTSSTGYSHSKTSSVSSISTTSTPQLSRTKNISETKTKASKAARRMGLIIKKPEDISNSSMDDPQETDASLNSNEFPSPLNFPTSSSSMDTSFQLVSPPVSHVGTTTISTQPATATSSSPPVTPTLTAATSRLPKPTRSRSNTLIEIDKMLENNDSVDTEHKSGAYFRRLSTLAEIPVDDTQIPTNGLNYTIVGSNPTSNNNSNPSSRNGSVTQRYPGSPSEEEDTTMSHTRTNSNIITKTPPVLKTSYSNITDSSSPSRKKPQDPEQTTLIGVSRKLLFAFSELHSSVRRFCGFCSDKKVAIKMVSYLYTAKANIDALVENLELMEDESNHPEKIVESLNVCIQSFKSIMSLLGDNFDSFVGKIDICFIRMLYLTVYGSFNEVFNAYRILVPSISQMKSPNLTDKKPTGLSINTNINDTTNDEVDAKLYDSIEIATSTALTVFGELTRVISKSAIANANQTEGSDPIDSQVATKVKDLTNVCVSSMDIVKRLRTKLITIRNNPSFTTKRLFWDDVNLFLKAIIQTFSSVKNLMKDLPVLNEIRSSMATLTKSTKDVTILLEASSYKSMSNDFNNSGPGMTHPPALSSIPSVSNIFTPLSAHPSHSQSHPNLPNHGPHTSHSQLNLSQLQNMSQVRTPLVAALGPAASAILPLSNDQGQVPPQPHSALNASPITSPNHFEPAPATAPQSTGQYFANNGINPFDGLIMERERERSDSQT